MSALRRWSDTSIRSFLAALAASGIWQHASASASPTPAATNAQDAGDSDGAIDEPAGAPTDATPGEPAGEVYPLHGYVSLGWRGRWTEGANDSDLFSFLTMDGGDPEKHAVTFHLTTRAAWDTGGGSPASSPFFEISDTYSNGFDARLYRAYADVHAIEALPVLRVGRQMDVETPEPAYFDGVHIRSEDVADGKLHFGGYGGLSTHLFESTDSEDNVFGAYIGARPWENGRVRLDWMQASDHRRSNGEGESLYSLGLWQTLVETLSLDGFVSMFRDAGRDLRFGGTWYEPVSDVQIRARYYQLLTTQTTSALEFDPFTSSLLDEAPYQQVSLSATKGFGPRYRLTGGVDLRRLENSQDAGQFNRDFDRGYLTVTFAELLEETTSISVTGDLWDGEDKRYATAGIDMTSKITDRLDTSIGTYFSMYKLRVQTLEEHEDVRTYFARVSYDLTADLQFDVRFDFEDTSLDNFQVLRMDLRWQF